MDVTAKDIEIIKKLNLTLDEYFIIYNKMGQFSELPLYRPKNEVYENLREKGLLDRKNDVSLEVKQVFANLNDEFLPSRAFLEHEFEQWWKVFPTTDQFKHWPRTRQIKTDKAQAKRKYIKAIEDGFSPEQLLEAIKADVDQRIKTSITSNNLKFIKSPARWLQSQDFADFLIKKEDISIVVKDALF
jgi:hypothetical protein